MLRITLRSLVLQRRRTICSSVNEDFWYFIHSFMSDSYNLMDCSPPGSSVYGDFPGKNTGVGCQGIFPTQGLNPSFLKRRFPPGKLIF